MSKILPEKVSMAELFYDLIYVLEVQKVTGVIHHLHHGQISIDTYLKFAFACLVILLLWFNQTIYINKYGTNSYYDIIGMFLHMFGAVYISNNISLDWKEVFVPFNVTAILMSLVIIAEYYLKSREYEKMPYEIKSQILILSLEIAALLLAFVTGPKYRMILAATAYLAAMFFPMYVMPRNDEEVMLNFPHLVERVSLITIIIFGEMVVGLAGVFALGKPSDILPLVSFVAAVLLFGTYVLQIEKMIEHHQKKRGFVLVYSHIGIFMGLSTITTSFGFALNPEVDWKFLIIFRLFGLLVYFVSMFSISVYNKENYRLKIKDVVAYLIFFIIGSLITGLSTKENIFLFNFGMFIMTFMIFGYMFNVVRKRR